MLFYTLREPAVNAETASSLSLTDNALVPEDNDTQGTVEGEGSASTEKSQNDEP